ncbi:MAG: hypothetical protein IJC43_04235 [Clostridia bacterium]|nr:hypothetical protein [Clostridia bacterium]
MKSVLPAALLLLALLLTPGCANDPAPPPALTVACEDRTLTAFRPAYTAEPGGVLPSVEDRLGNPLHHRADLPLLPADEGRVQLVFDTPPDALEVHSLPIARWDKSRAEATPVSVTEGGFSLLEGGHAYRVTATWSDADGFCGSAWYGFYTSPLDLEMTVENATSTGLTLVLDLADSEFAGKVLSGTRYRIERREAGEWQEVKLLHRNPFDWESVVCSYWPAISIQYEGTDVIRSPIRWDSRFGPLPPGHYRIGRTFTLFKTGEDYDYLAEFTIPQEDAAR